MTDDASPQMNTDLIGALFKLISILKESAEYVNGHLRTVIKFG